jgi:hypothetical protein
VWVEKNMKNEMIQQNSHKRSTIGLKMTTKERIDRCRAPGQCYDGFLQQMVDHWEKSQSI